MYVKATIKIESDNDAFNQFSPERELSRILRDCAERIEMGSGSGELQDYNGNTIGTYYVTITD